MRRTLSRITAWWALGGGILLLIITVVTSFNVGAFLLSWIGRGLGFSVEGLPGYEDFVRLLISSAALMFFPYCQLRRGHVAVDLFVSRLSRSVRTFLDRFWLALTSLAALFLGYWMLFGLIESRADQTATSILGWQEWPYYVPGLISLGLWAAVAAMQCVESAEEADHGA